MSNFPKTFVEFRAKYAKAYSSVDKGQVNGLRLIHGLLRTEKKGLAPYAWIEHGEFVTEVFDRDGCEFLIVSPREDFYADKNPVFVQAYNHSEAELLLGMRNSSGPWSLVLLNKFIESRSNNDFELPN